MLRDSYRRKRDNFNKLLTEHLNDVADWQIPAGGLFFWLRLRSEEPINTSELLNDALQRGVAFMPGEPFFPRDTGPSNALRLNFSHASEEEAERGLEILADLLRQRMRKGGFAKDVRHIVESLPL